jgi:HK97 family phage prohead protease
MTFQTKNMAASDFTLKGDDSDNPGHLVAKFSTFDIEDRMGDIVKSGALDDYNNTEILLCWAHNWTMPVGKGVIRVEKDHAVFDGHFWLDTTDGQEAYKKVKNAGSLQEYSWGFRILEWEPIKEEGEDDEDDYWWWGPVEITKAEPFEVSPVLIGANPVTETISLRGLKDSPEGRKLAKSATDNVTNDLIPADEVEPTLKEDDAEPAQGLRFHEEAEAALAAAERFVTRARSLAEKRAEEDRHLSSENVERLSALKTLIDELIEANTPVPEVVDKSDDDREMRLAVAKRRLIGA